jgi:hypothetical protein
MIHQFGDKTLGVFPRLQANFSTGLKQCSDRIVANGYDRALFPELKK